MTSVTKLVFKICWWSSTAVFLTSCVNAANLFSKETIFEISACKIDFSIPVELERTRFIPPTIWSQLEPCGMVNISRDTNRDKWGISAALNYRYSDVIVYDASMGFAVVGNLHWIGSTPANLEAWKDREDRKWQEHIKNRGGSGKRTLTRESRNGLECWRTEKTSYEMDKQSALSIAYACWIQDKTHYPPMIIGGWIRYWDGKPVYDLDIDRDLIDPVFATLEIKDIRPEVYIERMDTYKKEIEEDCKWRLKDKRRNSTREFNAYEIKRLEDCGHDTSKLKRKQE